MEQNQKIEKLKALLEEWGRKPVCVAFSGGVDSSLLLKLACDSGKRHGQPVYAVTFDTMLHPACDLETAKRVAKELQAEHVVLTVDELQMEGMRDNPPDRCYLCKKHLFQTLCEFAEAKGITCIMDGTNEDDLHVYRPGIRALSELQIKSPLALCGVTKQEVKEWAAAEKLSVASRPSTPCMATRLPYGTRLDYPLLRRIEEGETWLRTLFSGNVRLRVHGDIARIEVDGEKLEQAIRRRAEITARLTALGFTYVVLDLEGFRSGSMDVNLP